MVTIASVPVALPAVLSVTMAVGARQLARRKAVVSHLPAVEELGGIDVLCSDKTGTLTQNRLAVGDAVVRARHRAGDAARRCRAGLARRGPGPDRPGRARRRTADAPTESSVEAFTPFDPVSKRTEATVHAAGGNPVPGQQGRPAGDRRPVQRRPGAAQPPTSGCRSTPQRGDRSLAVARTDDGGTWRLLGVLPLADPPRADSARHDRSRQALGVQVKMVTGDQVAIGAQIARQIGLGDHILPAEALDARHRRRRRCRSVRPRRGRGRVRPGLPRAQVPHRATAAGTRPHRRHDRRRRQRRARAQAGRCRHRRLRRDRCRPRRRRRRAARARPVGDRRRHPAWPARSSPG